ncbi:MAG: hypothetical protein IPH76_18990 [Xanthomonadales bacterium]|nr:hypothetical protein [Xanthomonadales bacterium]
MRYKVACWLVGATLLMAGSGSARALSEDGMNDFACSLYGVLAGQQENLFFSLPHRRFRSALRWR